MARTASRGAAEEESAPRVVLPGGRGDPRRAILIALMMTMALAALDSTVVTTAVPSVVHDLGGFTLFPWLFSVYLLTQAVTVPIYGRAADIIGRKPVLLFGIGVFLLPGSVLCGFAWNMGSLIAFRGVQGLGAGAVIPIVQTVVGDLYSVKERARVTGYTASARGTSTVVGPLIGGTFSQYVSWRWIFFVNLPIGIYATVLIGRHLHEQIERRDHKLDVWGSVALTVGLASLILALLEGGSGWAWGSSREIVALAAGGLILAAFVAIERHAPEPMLPLWIVRRRPLVAGNITSVVIGAVLLGLTSYIPTWAQGVRHDDPLVAGLTVATITLGWPIASGFSGRIYLRFGFRATALLGTTTIAVFGTALFLTIDQSSSIFVAGAFGFVAGWGLGLASTPVMIAAQSLVGWERRERRHLRRTCSLGRSDPRDRDRDLRVDRELLARRLDRRRASSGRRGALSLGERHRGCARRRKGRPLTVGRRSYLRTGLNNATHGVFVAVLVVAIIGFIVAMVCFPSKLRSRSISATRSAEGNARRRRRSAQRFHSGLDVFRPSRIATSRGGATIR